MSTQSDEFLAISQQRYHNMRRRFGKTPFSITRFREFLIDLLGDHRGITRCEYCNTPLDIQRIELDHRIPPGSQGGSLGLDNLAACCACCNQQKGQMTAAAFKSLLNLVNDPHKFSEIDRTDVLGRLQSQLKLAMREQARLAQLRAAKVRITPHQRQRSA